MPHFRLTVAYDGTDFAGSQIQPNQRTVQGLLEDALEEIAAIPIRATFAGRTDRGVHALGQVVAVGLPTWSGTAVDLLRALNTRLPGDVSATDAAPCGESFNPRFDAIWREYRYWIAPGVVSPFLGRYAWSRRSEVDADAVRVSAGRLVGTHDFASFAGGGEGVPWSRRTTRPKGTARTILRCDCQEIWSRIGPGSNQPARVLEIRVAADGFLPHMVRNIVGALLDVGQGRRDPDWISELLAARDRRFGAVTAPAHGLTLTRIGFIGDLLDDN
jgi:tRNA pseudouridine38-40 synthase